MNEKISRRSFLKGGAIAAAGAASAATLGGFSTSAGAADVPEKWDYETDVAIIGFGGAGGAAAVEITRAGVECVIIEVDKYENRLSNTRMSGGITHCPDPAGDKEALKQYLRAMFSGENLPTKTEGEQSPLFVDDIVEKFAEIQPTLVDFEQSLDPDLSFMEFGGAAFPSFPGADAAMYRTFIPTYSSGFGGGSFYSYSDDPKETTSGGHALMRAIENALDQTPDLVTFLWDTFAKSLIQDANGMIIGVTALVGGLGGTPINIKARRGVIIASGGYEYNEEMRRAFLEGPGITGWAFYGTTSNTGQGIRMAVEIGAQLSKVGKAASRMIFCCPDVKVNNMSVGCLSESVGTAGTYCVNAEGKRFMDETLITRDPSRYFSYKEAVKMDITKLEFPNIPSYLIFDQKKFDAGPILSGSTIAWGIVPWDEENKVPLERGWLYKADTIQELAEMIRDKHDLNRGRLDPANMVAAADEYAEIVASGVDTHFNRQLRPGETQWTPVDTPPFYALPIVAGGPNTKGGLQADGDRHVIDWDNKIIPRLYTAGEISSVFKFVYQAGGNVTECMACGRIAGINAAAETPWE